MAHIGRSTSRGNRAGALLAQVCGPALALAAIQATADDAQAVDAETRAIFDILDENGDGTISRGEFLRKKTELFYRALADIDRDQRLSPAEINVTPEAFADADRNGDGMLSGSEFVQASFMQFEMIDAVGDQNITFEELDAFIRRYRP